MICLCAGTNEKMALADQSFRLGRLDRNVCLYGVRQHHSRLGGRCGANLPAGDRSGSASAGRTTNASS